ncbi:hypothetical protein GWK47_001590 [Chionoecetes opilio]|uniref:Uncharacterized protein n=1 Tax=Chionoecetes opilio TaxID=41210 RepID=A0A8J4XW48_CHIOP|nr:hypothetical protein GWK47_001590 [Chionoecetes opilio]
MSASFQPRQAATSQEGCSGPGVPPPTPQRGPASFGFVLRPGTFRGRAASPPSEGRRQVAFSRSRSSRPRRWPPLLQWPEKCPSARLYSTAAGGAWQRPGDRSVGATGSGRWQSGVDPPGGAGARSLETKVRSSCTPSWVGSRCIEDNFRTLSTGPVAARTVGGRQRSIGWWALKCRPQALLLCAEGEQLIGLSASSGCCTRVYSQWGGWKLRATTAITSTPSGHSARGLPAVSGRAVAYTPQHPRRPVLATR